MYNQIKNQRPTSVLRELLKGKSVRLHNQLWHLDEFQHKMVDETGTVVSIDFHEFLMACWEMENRDFNALQNEEGNG